MITVIGEKGTNEYAAATRIANFFEEMWPGISATPPAEDNIIIRASACISGQKRNEIDLLLIAQLQRQRRFRPNRAIRTREGVAIKDNFIVVTNIVAVGEEKGHSGSRVKVSGSEILVKYKAQNWKSATRQNKEQTHSLKNYLGDRGPSPFICKFIYLTNVSEKLGNSVNPSMTAQDFFSRLLEDSYVRQVSNRFEFRSCHPEKMGELFRIPVLQEYKPSHLDRRKMESLLSESKLVQSLVNDTPKMITQISGVGGTGKTVILLQAASRFYRERGERSLFLTFNVPLASEIQRLMAFQKIKSSDDDGGIKIQTVMSFFYTLFERLGLENSGSVDEHTFADYKPLLELVEEEIITNNFAFSDLIANNLDEFEFDKIFVDEAQDWHTEEANILKKFYIDTPITVADGKQQMIRTLKPARWFEGVPKENRRFEQLKRCIRLKSSLAGFLKSFALKFDQSWEGEVFSKASGGQIILNSGDYESTSIHEELKEYSKIQNVDNIDWLFVVPPSAVKNGPIKTTTISNYLRDQGYEVMDLVEHKVRKEIHSDPKMFRVVQYEGCRGLEGWVTVLYKFDQFLEMKMCLFSEIDVSKPYNFNDLDIQTKQFVWNWLSMVFSRAMDTIVLNISNTRYGIGRVIVDHCRQNEDCVTFKPNIR